MSHSSQNQIEILRRIQSQSFLLSEPLELSINHPAITYTAIEKLMNDSRYTTKPLLNLKNPSKSRFKLIFENASDLALFIDESLKLGYYLTLDIRTIE